MSEPTEIDRERGYVDGLFGRLDELTAEAEQRLAETRRQAVGGNHQSRSERDAYARLYEDTIATLERVGDRLVFGRLEVSEPDSDEDAFRYIGRVGLRDRDHRPLLLDWRVPGASAFYQATAAHPMGMRARRHLTLDGRSVIGVEDEVFDASLYDDERTHLQGEGALLAAVTAERTGRMTDIVATIQGEQDRIIRSPLEGVLIVQGGPGTGKTAVALHRAAYLLYSYRERLRGSGVLMVGPSPAFLTYIEQVLPSLGETGVVMASLGSLYPGVHATRHDQRDVAAVKGSAEMAQLLRRAVRSRQVVPTESVTLDVEGERLVVPPELVADAMKRAQDRGKPHNAARVTFNKIALDAMTRLLAEQLRERGTTVDEADEKVLREDIRSSYDARVLLNTAWLPLPPRSSSRTCTPDRTGSPRSPRTGPRNAGHSCCATAVPSSRSRTSRSSTRPPSSSARSTPPAGLRSVRPRRAATATSRTPARRSRTWGSRASSRPSRSPGPSPRAATPAPRPSAPPRTASGPTATSSSTRRRSSRRCSGACSPAGTRSGRSPSWATWRRGPRPGPRARGTTWSAPSPVVVGVVRRWCRSSTASRSSP